MVSTQRNKDVVMYFKNLFGLDKLNWGFQMKLANSLLSKYNFNEIKYALDYYKNNGMKLNSLGFLTYKNNMKDPTSLYNAEKNITGGDGSGDRNWKRITKNCQTYNGEKSAEYLFAEPNETD